MILVYTFSLEGLFFFCLGAFLCLHRIRFFGGVLGKVAISVCAICFVIMRVTTLRCGWDYSHYFVWLAIPFCLATAWFIMPSTKQPTFLQGVAFPIYLLHMFFLLPQGRGLSLLAPRNVVAYLGVLIFVVGCSLVATWIIRRTCSKIAAFIFGGR